MCLSPEENNALHQASLPDAGQKGPIVRYAAAGNFAMPNRVLIDAAAIAGVALDGINNAVFDLLDDTGMIGPTVLQAGAALVSQSKKMIMPGPAP